MVQPCFFVRYSTLTLKGCFLALSVHDFSIDRALSHLLLLVLIYEVVLEQVFETDLTQVLTQL